MAIQLTPEQEQRLHRVVSVGAYRSTEEALEAAVSALEMAAATGFEGSPEELDTLLVEGLNSGEPMEADDEFWNRLRAETDALLMEHASRKHVLKS